MKPVMHKKMKYQYERNEYGPKEPSKAYSNGLSREEYTAPWEDNCTMGVLYALHKYSSEFNMSMNMIGSIIGWKRRSVKSSLDAIRKSELMKNAITVIKVKGSKVNTLFRVDSPVISGMSFHALKKAFFYSFYSKDPNLPNTEEQRLLDICNELYPDSFDYTGSQKKENEIGSLYPDIRHKIYRHIVLEHFGSHHHDPSEEIERIRKLAKLGLVAEIVWDCNKKRRNIIKKQVKEFVDNALQDIQQLAV